MRTILKPPIPHNQALRRLTADLAQRPDGEIADVLHRLAPDRRQRVQALLNEIRRVDVPAGAMPHEMPAGLSPWLAERLTLRPDTPITDHAAQALRRCAASLTGGPAAVAKKETPSLLSRLTARKPAGHAS